MYLQENKNLILIQREEKDQVRVLGGEGFEGRNTKLISTLLPTCPHIKKQMWRLLTTLHEHIRTHFTWADSHPLSLTQTILRQEIQ